MDYEQANEKIGYIPRNTIGALHDRIDSWALKILEEIDDIKKEIRTTRRTEKS